MSTTSHWLDSDGEEPGLGILALVRLSVLINSSPEDQAILEASYAVNSKPDKAARLQLVEQVGLGEKEVQVSAYLRNAGDSYD